MQATAAAIERQYRAGFRRLRFAPELERQFRREHTESVRVQRLLLLVIGAVLVALMPFVDGWLLNPPEAFVSVARRVQFGAILPAMLLAFAFTAEPRLRRWSDPAGLAALVVVVAGWVYLRYVGWQHQYELPVILIGVVLAGSFALAGLFFWAIAPVAALGLIVFAGLEYWVHGGGETVWFNNLSLLLLALVTAMAGYLQEYQQREQWLRHGQLLEASRRDSLTGLLNHAAFMTALEALHTRAARERRPLTVVMLDVDHFKEYNDHYGHLQGDDCLRRVAAALERATGAGEDLCGRTGGEEFTLAWLGAKFSQVAPRVAAVLDHVRELGLPHAARPDRPGGRVTVSAGAAWAVPACDLPASTLWNAADEALYRSKHGGRDRATVEAFRALKAVPQASAA